MARYGPATRASAVGVDKKGKDPRAARGRQALPGPRFPLAAPPTLTQSPRVPEPQTPRLTHFTHPSLACIQYFTLLYSGRLNSRSTAHCLLRTQFPSAVLSVFDPPFIRCHAEMASASSSPVSETDLNTLIQSLPACRRCRDCRRGCDTVLPKCRQCAKANVDCIFYDHGKNQNLPRR
jgi:hypothetical protein